MITYDKYCKALETIKAYEIQQNHEITLLKNKLTGFTKWDNVKKDVALEDTDVTVRLFNILLSQCSIFRSRETPIHNLSKLSKKEFLSYKGAGKKLLKELEHLCESAGIKMLP